MQECKQTYRLLQEELTPMWQDISRKPDDLFKYLQKRQQPVTVDLNIIKKVVPMIRCFREVLLKRPAATVCDLYHCVARHQMKQKIVQDPQIKLNDIGGK